jgi:hypothetical protein
MNDINAVAKQANNRKLNIDDPQVVTMRGCTV